MKTLFKPLYQTTLSNYFVHALYQWNNKGVSNVSYYAISWSMVFPTMFKKYTSTLHPCKRTLNSRNLGLAKDSFKVSFGFRTLWGPRLIKDSKNVKNNWFYCVFAQTCFKKNNGVTVFSLKNGEKTIGFTEFSLNNVKQPLVLLCFRSKMLKNHWFYLVFAQQCLKNAKK